MSGARKTTIANTHLLDGSTKHSVTSTIEGEIYTLVEIDQMTTWPQWKINEVIAKLENQHERAMEEKHRGNSSPVRRVPGEPRARRRGI